MRAVSVSRLGRQEADAGEYRSQTLQRGGAVQQAPFEANKHGHGSKAKS